MWAFELSGEREYIESENRLAHKPSKRDVACSKRNLIESAEKHRLNSNEVELDYPRYMRINNTDKSASDVANHIFGIHELARVEQLP